MSAYIIGRVEITDWPRYLEYMKHTPGIIARHGGKFIARGGETTTLEGPAETSRVIILEFPDLESARSFYQSSEYQEAKGLREGAALAQFVMIDGCKG